MSFEIKNDKYTFMEHLPEGCPADEPQKQMFFIKRLALYLSLREKKINRKLTFHVHTFGCQMNAKDSEKLSGILSGAGMEQVNTEEADIVVYNTCTVRENANTKVYGRLGYLKNLKEKNPEMLIAMCGCMMQEPEVIDKIKKSYHFVDIIFGTYNIFELAELICARIDTGKMVVSVIPESKKIVEEIPSSRKFSFKAGVNIMYGCNNFCSYCIVPYVRGREKSRLPEDIIKECEKLAGEGVSEIMLLGQNVNSYGNTFEDKVSFSELLSEIEKVKGIRRIRFMTPHPKDLSDELIDTIAESKKICRHVHLPLQSGSSRVLGLMNRHYTKEQYLSLVEKIRKRIPDVEITTDIIVGFPGETEEDFMETLDVVDKAGFESAYTFIYSRRTGTPAAGLPDQIPTEVVNERFNRLLKLQQEKSAQVALKYVNTDAEVLIEEIDGCEEGYLTGRMSNNLQVHFKANASMLGRYAMVHIDESRGFYYFGTLL